MASDGLLRRAKTGKCQMCLRVRKVDTQVKEVGEVNHGYATGHIWECIDAVECEQVIIERIAKYDDPDHPVRSRLEFMQKIGRAKEYIYRG